MASGQGDIPGNAIVWIHHMKTTGVIILIKVVKIPSKASNILSFFHHFPALESGLSSGLCGALSSPIGMTRHNISYDEHIDAPMHSPPPDMTMNIFWKDPVIPQHRFRNTAEVLPVHLNFLMPVFVLN